MAQLKLRDRDAVLTEENLIFRVYGYFHPSDAYACDIEYAPATVFKSASSKALRRGKKQIYYKFYTDEGLRFVQQKYPHYMILYEPLQEHIVGVQQRHIVKTRKPDEKFRRLLIKQPEDVLLKAMHTVFDLVTTRSILSENDFGVFGSLLHDFYHPSFSDIDFVVYGREKLTRLHETLKDLCREEASLQNEFETEKAVEGKRWKFMNYSPKEFLWHQRRKMIYALFNNGESGRAVKTEFEPVKDWKEIHNEYGSDTRIVNKGWIRAIARVIDDRDAPFIPSVYQIETIEILKGLKVDDIQRILSYVEEFRLQAKRDEKVYVEGKLEQVATPTKTFHQITLSYGSRYYEQVLKVSQI